MGLGALLGFGVGLPVGTTVDVSGDGCRVGLGLGALLGLNVGLIVEAMIDGVSDSIMDGTALALELGCCVGIRLVDGILVGAIDGN